MSGLNSETQPSKRLLNALKGQKTDRPPFWLMRQAGRYLPEYKVTRKEAGSFLDLCYSPTFAVEVTHQPLRRYGMDGAILFSDILVVPDALGQDVSFVEGKGPVLIPVRNTTDLSALSQNRLHDHLRPVYDTVAELRRTLDPSVTLLGFCGAPWTVATYMVEGGTSKDHAKTRHWAYSDPESFQVLIDLLVDASSTYLIEQLNHGADAVQIFDTWAGALTEPGFDRWALAPVQKIVANVRAVHPEAVIIGFPRGVGPLYEKFVTQTGVNAVSIDYNMSVTWARDHIQPHVCVQGNIDPQVLVAGGDILNSEIDRIVSTLNDGPYVVNLGHGIVPETPPEHVAQLVDRIKNWS